MDIRKIMIDNYQHTDTLFTHNPVVSLFFLIDKQGKAYDYGILRKDMENFYNKNAINMGKIISESVKFTPSKIDEEEVTSFFILSIQFSNLSCNQFQLK